MNYRGTRWYKCDFHLHTYASRCFEDTATTPQAFVDKIVAEKLDCVAITDHNNGRSIDEIKEQAAIKGIIVFPGVEITCSDAKVHLLVIFDVNKSSSDIEDFLIKLDINRADFGKDNAHVHKEVYEVLKIANLVGAIVIPAHIDEYNGLSIISNESKKKCFESELILGVQIVHNELLHCGNNETELAPILSKIIEYYNDETINLEKIKLWKSCNDHIKDLAKLTFSDNPLHENSTKHGLWGIGKKYTWIKMNENPDLESLRQALLIPSLRIKNCYESVDIPYEAPTIWIKSLTIHNSNLQHLEPIEFEFSPQLTTIIGGRGSGKSTLIQILRGLFKKSKDIEGISSVNNEFNEFYKITDSKGKGIISEETKISCKIYLNGSLYRITATNIKNIQDQTITIEKANDENESFTNIDNSEFINLFSFDIYSQKQIYEIAQAPNVLRERIDSAIGNVNPLKNEIESLKEEYIAYSADIRSITNQLETRKIYEAESQEKEIQIDAFKESGVADLLEERKTYSSEGELFKVLESTIDIEVTRLKEYCSEIKISLPDNENLSTLAQIEYLSIQKFIEDKMINIHEDLKRVEDNFEELKNAVARILIDSDWKNAVEANKLVIEEQKLRLSEKGVADIENFEKILEEKEQVSKKLTQLDKLELELKIIHEKKAQSYANIFEVSKKISDERSQFLNSIPLGDNVEINIKQYRDREQYEQEFRSIIQKNTGYEESINYLVNKCFSGRLPENLEKVYSDLDELRKGIVPYGYDAYFKNSIVKLDDSLFVKLKLIIPEDQIFARYKPVGATEFKNISNASAGQKTSTVLTYLLSHGLTPLVLDQPEDDLDNHLVYGLIVDRLSQSKQNRQIIIVTHNANIPVNGDAEFVMAMDSQSKWLKISHKGTIEEKEIKEEICEVMEGGEPAFAMRAKRYNIKKQ